MVLLYSLSAFEQEQSEQSRDAEHGDAARDQHQKPRIVVGGWFWKRTRFTVITRADRD